MTASPLVSVIVVTLDNPSLLEKCLASLSAQSYSDVEIIVVDNGGTQKTREVLSRFAQAKVIRPGKNLGFAGGNNKGMQSARGAYIALINDDAEASPGWVASMVACAQADPQVGQVASVIIDGNAPGTLDSCGMGMSLDAMARQSLKGKPVPQLDAPREVLMASGCACMFRASALKEVGYFDEDFFAYCEDSDLGLRLRFAGWKAVAAPGAEVTHHYSMTMGKFSTKKVYFVERNHYWVAVKNFPLSALVCLPFVTLWRFMLSALLMAQGHGAMTGFRDESGAGGLGMVFVKAWFDMLKQLPMMWGKRSAHARRRKLTPSEMMALLKKFRLPMKEILGAGE